jgi:DNA polymerase III delta subunit
MNESINSNKYLLKTKDIFLINNFLGELKRKKTGYKVVRCAEVEEFINKSLIIDLFDDYKKILILNDLTPDALDPLVSMIHCKTEDVLVLIQQGTLSRTKSYTIIKGACQLVEFNKLNESECAVWVRKWLKDYDLIFSEDIPSHIVFCVGMDISKLESEVKKIKFYFNGSKDRILTKSVCSEIFTESNDVNYFGLVENLLRKRIVDVFHELKKIDDYSLVKLNHMIINQVEKIYKVAIYREQKFSIEDICELLSISKYILTTKFYSFLSLYNKTKLIMLLDILNELDNKLRLTQYNKHTVFESYILKIIKL